MSKLQQERKSEQASAREKVCVCVWEMFRTARLAKGVLRYMNVLMLALLLASITRIPLELR